MRAYDKLPPRIREVLANSCDNWAAQPYVTALKRGMSEEQLIAETRRIEVEWRSKYYRQMRNKTGCWREARADG